MQVSVNPFNLKPVSVKPAAVNFKSPKKNDTDRKSKLQSTTLFHTFIFHKNSWIPCITLLNNKKLIMLKSKYEYKPSAVIDFSIFKTRIEASSQMKKEYILSIVIDEANYKLQIKAIDKRSYQKLITCVRIRSNQHDPFLKFNYESDENFFKKLYIREHDFLSSANSGDLLLFK